MIDLAQYLMFWRTIRKLRDDLALQKEFVENIEISTKTHADQADYATESMARLDREKSQLQSQLEQENGAKLRLIDEVRELRARISEVEPRLATALERESTAVKAVADFLSQQMFGRPIWGVGAALPEKKDELEPLRRRPTMEDIRRQELEAFYETAYAHAKSE